jgi:hypothetical protein
MDNSTPSTLADNPNEMVSICNSKLIAVRSKWLKVKIGRLKRSEEVEQSVSSLEEKAYTE